MKGVVFTKFLDFVESRFGAEFADSIVTRSTLPSGGAYTTVGTYDHHELLTLLLALQETTGVAIPTLVREYGRHLFGELARGYPHLIAGIPDLFTLLERIENTIHVEVKKLYPDAKLPTIVARRQDAATIELTYRSERGFADLAQGLIEGAARHYGTSLDLARADLAERPGTHVRFTVRLQAAVPA
ncbi:MAG: hypothetical protein EXS13_07890 [Planctomycetes bacterium]|nr:hypothetical protein [Planctomycetota bacterium]